MLKEEIVVGKSYVNEGACVIREVVEEVDHHRVKYISFEVESGKLLPARHRTCDRRELRRWADREAKAQGTARIHPFEARATTGFAAERYAWRPEEVRTIADAAPGAHTFPRVK